MSLPNDIEIVGVRAKWPDEARNFTPWLARNLDLLGTEVGLDLELVREEKAVGPLSLDILARESETGVSVAIENQLEWSDVDHFGRLLVYAAGCDARVAIWVAPEFRYEYAETMHRLNQWTGNYIQFYCVKVEAFKPNPDSEIEGRFRKVVYPGVWDKALTLPPEPPPSPEIQKFRDFFQPLIYRLIQKGFSDKPRQRFGPSGRHFLSPAHSGIWYAPSMETKNDAWVTLHIEMETKERTTEVFNTLNAKREEIESTVPFDPKLEWVWRRHDGNNFASISIRRDGSIDDPPEKLDEIRDWMLDLLPKFRQVFEPILADVLK